MYRREGGGGGGDAEGGTSPCTCIEDVSDAHDEDGGQGGGGGGSVGGLRGGGGRVWTHTSGDPRGQSVTQNQDQRREWVERETMRCTSLAGDRGRWHSMRVWTWTPIHHDVWYINIK